jgi:hypothetical protein
MQNDTSETADHIKAEFVELATREEKNLAHALGVQNRMGWRRGFTAGITIGLITGAIVGIVAGITLEERHGPGSTIAVGVP